MFPLASDKIENSFSSICIYTAIVKQTSLQDKVVYTPATEVLVLLAVGRFLGAIEVEIGKPSPAVCATFCPRGRCRGATDVVSITGALTALDNTISKVHAKHITHYWKSIKLISDYDNDFIHFVAMASNRSDTSDCNLSIAGASLHT